MEDYKKRMVEEYQELFERTVNLESMLSKYDNGELNFDPTCPIDLLRIQFNVMKAYLDILYMRAEIEDIDLWNKNA